MGRNHGNMQGNFISYCQKFKCRNCGKVLYVQAAPGRLCIPCWMKIKKGG